MIFEWRCCNCYHVNETNMDKWKKVKDGQGFKAECDNCKEEKDVDIEIKVY